MRAGSATQSWPRQAAQTPFGRRRIARRVRPTRSCVVLHGRRPDRGLCLPLHSAQRCTSRPTGRTRSKLHLGLCRLCRGALRRSHQHSKLGVQFCHLLRRVSPHRLAVTVEQEQTVEVPPYVSREGVLRVLPHGVGRFTVHRDLLHQRTAGAIRGKPLARDEARYLLGGKFLGAEFVAGIQKELDLLSVRVVPLFELLVHAVRKASARGHVHDEGRLALKGAELDGGALD
mmetsp:Transcript_60088/g.164669  ORF Transcript_60088/g.164669 Transcript_60088/m.164669 type:complete len:230 (-) Transcript_60088:1-690(-)